MKFFDQFSNRTMSSPGGTSEAMLPYGLVEVKGECLTGLRLTGNLYNLCQKKDRAGILWMECGVWSVRTGGS